MQTRFFMSLAVVSLVFTFAFAFAVGAQETTDASATAAPEDSSGQRSVFAEDDSSTQADAQFDTLAGPLAGTRVGTFSTDDDGDPEIIRIPRPDCTAKEGASFVLQDEDGTQADFIDNVNVQITNVRKGLKVTSNPALPGADIEALNVRGGKDKIPALDTGGLVIVTSTDIVCEGDNPTPPPDNTPPPDDGPDPTTSPTPEPQDKEKGPLAGGTAFGKNVLVKDDLLYVLPNGQKVYGIDQIIIKTKDCELTAQGDDLTITLGTQGGPIRLRDGQNVDITIKSDGTIVANGRKTLGDYFPESVRDNPTRVIVPIPVDPESYEYVRKPDKTFPIISSTGIGGEGCHVLEDADAGNTDGASDMDNGTNAGNTNSSDDVIPNTTSDKPLPDTGGVPLLGLVVSGLFFAVVSVLLLSSKVRRSG